MRSGLLAASGMKRVSASAGRTADLTHLGSGHVDALVVKGVSECGGDLAVGLRPWSRQGRTRPAPGRSLPECQGRGGLRLLRSEILAEQGGNRRRHLRLDGRNAATHAERLNARTHDCHPDAIRFRDFFSVAGPVRRALTAAMVGGQNQCRLSGVLGQGARLPTAHE